MKPSSFVLDGFWWTSTEPSTHHAGQLVTEEGRSYLTLTIKHSEQRRPFHSEYNNYEVIYGHTTDGKKLSLLMCYDVDSSYSGEIERRRILVNYVLVGGFVPTKTDNKEPFKSLHLKWPSLKRWFYYNDLIVEHDADNFHAFDIRYRPHDSISFSYKDGTKIAFEFSTDNVPFGGPLSDEIHLREVVWITVTPSTPRDLEFFLGLLDELKQFFSLCVLEYSQPEEITLVGNFDPDVRDDHTTIYPHLDVYAESAHTAKTDSKPHPIEILIPFHTVKDYFPEIVEGWHNLAEKVQPARALYFSALYGSSQNIESRFLYLIQAIEVFHRRTYGGTYLEGEKYSSEVLPRLRSAIPGELQREIKDAYMQRLEFLNEFSLSKRLKMMLSNHQAVFDEYLPDWRTFVRRAVQARNYYTHYSDRKKDTDPDVQSLFDFQMFIRVLLELEMLANSGVNKSDLHNRARECMRYRLIFRGLNRNIKG